MKFILLLVTICVFSSVFTRSHSHRRAKTHRFQSRSDLISCDNKANIHAGLNKVDSFLKSFTQPKTEEQKFKEQCEVELKKLGCKFSAGWETLKDNIKKGFNTASKWVEGLFKKDPKAKAFLESQRYQYGDFFTCSQKAKITEAKNWFSSQFSSLVGKSKSDFEKFKEQSSLKLKEFGCSLGEGINSLAEYLSKGIDSIKKWFKSKTQRRRI